MTAISPQGWVTTTLADVAEVRLGRQRSPKNHAGTNMRPYLRAANVTWGGIDLSDVKEMHFSTQEVDTYRLMPGDVLVAEASGSRSEVGKPALWRGEIDDCCFQNTLLRVRSRAPLPDYILYYLLGQALQGRLGDAARGVGIHHLGAGGLSSYPIPVPPLSEQERIVAAIEEQLSRLEAAETSLNGARVRLPALRRAALDAAFDQPWPVKQLVEVTSTERPICYGILKPRVSQEAEVPYVEVRSIRSGAIDVAGLHRTTQALHEEFRRSELRPGDVVLAIRGSYDRAAVVPPVLAGANVSRDVARIAPLPMLEPGFLGHFLESPTAQDYYGRHVRGVGVRGINIGDLRKLDVPVPSLEEQRAAIQLIDQQLSLIDAFTNAIASALRRSSQLRRAILERAFCGELVSQDPRDEPATELLSRIAAERPGTPTARRRRQA